jgi:uroporphyrinogen decarboxylase
MNGRDRLADTFRGKQADRMPISPFINLNNIYEMFRYKPNIDTYLSPGDFDLAEKFVAYHDFFGFDVLFTPGLLWDSYIPQSAENWDVTITREGDEDKQRRTTVIRTPAGELRQVMNFNRSSPYMIVLALEKYLIETPQDFSIFSRYVPPARFIDCDLMRRARQSVGDKGLVNPATHGAFNTLNQFRKLEDMMSDPITDEGFYRAMIGFLLDWNMAHLRDVIRAGADAIEISANLATSAVGPRFFERYVMEYENRLAQQIHEAGAFVVYHNCGDAQEIMHLYNDLEIDVWGYLTGPPFGDVILDDALRIIRPNMALRGNIDQVEFLRKATPVEVKQRVRELIEKVKPRGNWILCTTDFPFDGQPYENLYAFAEAGREYGGYD